jgi:hypothetical protein
MDAKVQPERNRTSKKLLLWGAITLSALFFGLFAYSVGSALFGGDDRHPPNAMAKVGLIKAYEAILKYAEAHEGHYPPNIDDINAWEPDTYLPDYNYFKRGYMREIHFKESPFAGEYTYIPYEEDGKVCGFYLLVYGASDFSGEDVDGDGVPDHVLLVLKSDGSSEHHATQSRGDCVSMEDSQ